MVLSNKKRLQIIKQITDWVSTNLLRQQGDKNAEELIHKLLVNLHGDFVKARAHAEEVGLNALIEEILSFILSQSEFDQAVVLGDLCLLADRKQVTSIFVYTTLKNTFIDVTYESLAHFVLKMVPNPVIEQLYRRYDADYANWQTMAVSTHAEVRTQYLRKILDLYTFPFFEKNTGSLVQKVISNDLVYKEILDSMRLIVPLDDDEPQPTSYPEWLRSSVLCRYPVYFGNPRTDMYRMKSVQSLLQYNESDILDANHTTHYAIFGKAFVANRPDYVYVTHVWGINFESETTADYKRFLGKNQRLKQDLYKKETEKILRSVAVSALIAFENEDGKRISVRIPAVGLGVYLQQLKNLDDRQFAFQTFFETLVAMATQYEEQMNVTVCVKDDRSEMKACVQKYVLSVGSSLNYSDDLFDVPNTGVQCLVNAWDSCSYIGNGGSHDPTIDGMLVAGILFGKSLPNSSYLHNAFISVPLLEPNMVHPAAQTIFV